VDCDITGTHNPDEGATAIEASQEFRFKFGFGVLLTADIICRFHH